MGTQLGASKSLRLPGIIGINNRIIEWYQINLPRGRTTTHPCEAPEKKNHRLTSNMSKIKMECLSSCGVSFSLFVCVCPFLSVPPSCDMIMIRNTGNLLVLPV